MPSLRLAALFLVALLLAGCSGMPTAPDDGESGMITTRPAILPQQEEIAMYALMLLNTDYRFGGKNPSAGLDCSGMVSYVYRKAAGIELTGSAAELAHRGRPVSRDALRPGDLLFFNTLRRPFSHVGIYLGRGQFIHAANERSGVRIDRLANPYYARHFEAARTLF